MPSDRPRLIRILVLAAILVAIEGAVFLFGYVTPALAGLMRPVYWVVAGFFAVAMAHSARPRATGDRRHGDRRGPS